MTDTSTNRAAEIVRKGLGRRHRKQTVLKGLGLAAILFAFLMLAILVGSLVASGYKAFTQTFITVEVFVDPEEIREERLPRGGFDDVLVAALAPLVPGVDPEDRGQMKKLEKLFSDGAQFQLRDMVVADPALIGQTVRLTAPMSDPYDQLAKGLIDPETPEVNRRVKDDEIAFFAALDEAGMIAQKLNTGLITNADSRFPELAGLKGALIGSAWALLVCFLISFPLGIGAAIYLEEFAPKNKMSDFIEVNINNLAAVPSVVFGLLALAVFIGWFGLPRSAPLVGGMTLALMTMPTIIIATRAALRAVPPSIREAALGVGASKHQVVFGHVLPLAMPGILTGTIIGLAQALGETAPLLLIGMNAFITSAPDSPMASSTALPTQIFIWADSPERLVLLTFLITMNAIAIFLRNRFERKW